MQTMIHQFIISFGELKKIVVLQLSYLVNAPVRTKIG